MLFETPVFEKLPVMPHGVFFYYATIVIFNNMLPVYDKGEVNEEDICSPSVPKYAFFQV